MSIHTKWHGKERYFGLHYDLHGNKDDTELGTRAQPELLVPMLELMNPDFVQTDCKGHPGYTSWFSKVAEASVPSGLTDDALMHWRAATRQLGLPLHCHYSGLWDSAAGSKHPEWAVKGPDGEATGAPFGASKDNATNDIMCPRGPYIDELLIPQFIELIDRYEIDGFWVDGEIWGAKPCYCDTCLDAWREESGETDAPVDVEDPRWSQWMGFVRRSFKTYVAKYCRAVHEHKPGVLVCSNWLQTFKDPGEPAVPTDWISGDNTWVWGLDQSRCEARFLSTRRKHWDIMIWAFYSSGGLGNPQSPMTLKPVDMLAQEAGCLAAFGGNVQIYEHPPVRDGRLVEWRQQKLGEVGEFIKKRQALCTDTETIPQIAVLHSEHHLQKTISGPNLLWNVDTKPVEGAVYALLEHGYGVDILDEWALTPRIDDFPLVVIPEQDRMSDDMKDRLVEYVKAGGCALITGAGSYERFGAEVIGARVNGEETEYRFALESDMGDVPVYSDSWLRLECGTATPCLVAWDGTRLDDKKLDWPAAVINRYGAGQIIYASTALFKYFAQNRYPGVRTLVGDLVALFGITFDIRVSVPVAVDVALRSKQGSDGNTAKTIVHLLNRSSGIPNQPNNGAIDDIPCIGPVTIRIKSSESPRKVYRAYESGGIEWRHDGNEIFIDVPAVRIHEAIVVE
jgi:hypothetical protein